MARVSDVQLRQRYGRLNMFGRLLLSNELFIKLHWSFYLVNILGF